MPSHRLALLAPVLVAMSLAAQPTPSQPAGPPAGWVLVWHDEFDQPGAPDPARWSYDVGGHGWGNYELQFYTDDRRANARVENGVLVIEAHREPWGSRDYTSARLVSRGKGEWTGGRFEIRARVPVGRGTWPAIWMLPTVWDLGDGRWPDNGEIDIMEHVGHDPGVIHASLHSRRHQWQNHTQRTAKIEVPDIGRSFHVYVLEWEEDEIRVSVDGTCFFTVHRNGGDWTSWPFFRDFHFVLNIAVGGLWGAVKGIDDEAFPQRMEIDYIRVYQREGGSATPGTGTPGVSPALPPGNAP